MSLLKTGLKEEIGPIKETGDIFRAVSCARNAITSRAAAIPIKIKKSWVTFGTPPTKKRRKNIEGIVNKLSRKYNGRGFTFLEYPFIRIAETALQRAKKRESGNHMGLSYHFLTNFFLTSDGFCIILMGMSFLRKFFDFFPLPTAYAHCDIPCGIYDPHAAQLAAHTVIRMTSLIQDLKIEQDAPMEARKKFIHALSRYTKVKEEQAEIIKHEVRVLWGDYFKEEHMKEYPELSDLVYKVLKHASKAKQEINMEEAEELLQMVQEIAEIFFKTNGVEPVRVKAPYPTGGEIVLHK